MADRCKLARAAYGAAYEAVYRAAQVDPCLTLERCHRLASQAGQQAANAAHSGLVTGATTVADGAPLTNEDFAKVHYDTGVIGSLACGWPSGLVTRDMRKVTCTQCLCSPRGISAAHLDEDLRRPARIPLDKHKG